MCQPIAVIIFIETNTPFQASGSLFKLAFISFVMTLVVLNSFLAIGYTNMFQVHFVHYLSLAYNQHFFKVPVSYWGQWTWMPGMLIAVRMTTSLPFSAEIARISVYHTHNIDIQLFKDKASHQFILILLIQIQDQGFTSNSSVLHPHVLSSTPGILVFKEHRT